MLIICNCFSAGTMLGKMWFYSNLISDLVWKKSISCFLGLSDISIFELLFLKLNNKDLTCWYSNGDVFLPKHYKITKFKKFTFINGYQSRFEIDFFQTDHSREQFSVLTEWIETRTRGVSLADGLNSSK